MKIRELDGRKNGSCYARLFNNNDLGYLMSKIQATVISNGSELERIILTRSNQINDLALFIDDIETGEQKFYPDGVYVCSKKILQKSRYSIKGIEPDLLVFVVMSRRICQIIELKDGDSFDTKKAAAERMNLERFAKEFGSNIPFTTKFFICCFNQLDKEEIFKGFKGKFEMEHIMTGRELCELLNINYAEIIAMREQDAQDNIYYFLEELIKIPDVKKLLKQLIKRGAKL